MLAYNSSQAIETAIAINGVDVEKNRQAFRLGRLAAHDTAAVDRLSAGSRDDADPPATLDDIIAARTSDLIAYQDRALANRYQQRVTSIRRAEERLATGGPALAQTVAQAYHKLLAIKDEYEVARLFTDGRFEREIAGAFENVAAIQLHLAPPLISRIDPATGRPVKRRFGSWIMPLLRLLARAKRLRGTPFDIFGYSAERRAERRLIALYEADLDRIATMVSPENLTTAIALASWPLQIKGYGIVKHDAIARAKAHRADLVAAMEHTASPDTRSAAE